FQSHHSEAAYLLVLLLMKGNKLTAGNRNNDSAIQIDRTRRISVPGLHGRYRQLLARGRLSNKVVVAVIYGQPVICTPWAGESGNSGRPLSSIKTNHYQAQLIEKCTVHRLVPINVGTVRVSDMNDRIKVSGNVGSIQIK
ncbi:MAG: hypothetical protein U9Q07_10005, partial [Planctomycetota bacterium]|nr:hypothetical protein [Planctomycetota bacterium]